MKKILLFVLSVLCFEFSFAEKRALVVGIGKYPVETGWDIINGDKDIPIVCDYLKFNGFKPQNIVLLKNEEATGRAIRDAFTKLIGKATEGDIIYIHFSGHGQQITDLSGDEKDDCWDESWVAYDACIEYQEGIYEGENHILDDQLNVWLSDLRNKVGPTGKITVIADACHSGTLSSWIDIGYSILQNSTAFIPSPFKPEGFDDENLITRGGRNVFMIPKGKNILTSELMKVEWIFISACQPWQCNREYKGVGSLTYAISLHKHLLSNKKYSEVVDSIKATMKNKLSLPTAQTPYIEEPETINQQTIF